MYIKRSSLQTLPYRMKSSVIHIGQISRIWNFDVNPIFQFYPCCEKSHQISLQCAELLQYILKSVTVTIFSHFCLNCRFHYFPIDMYDKFRNFTNLSLHWMSHNQTWVVPGQIDILQDIMWVISKCMSHLLSFISVLQQCITKIHLYVNPVCVTPPLKVKVFQYNNMWW